jgi:hypothetical protein
LANTVVALLVFHRDKVTLLGIPLPIRQQNQIYPISRFLYLHGVLAVFNYQLVNVLSDVNDFDKLNATVMPMF